MTTRNDPVVIVSAARTPMGGFQGELASLTAPQLGATAIRASVERAGIAADSIDAVLMGCVLAAGLGQAPARQAALGAGLSQATPCTTLNKMCGSGMQAAIFGHDLLLAGSAALPLAGLGLHRLLHKTELAVVTGTVLGVALAASAWAMRGLWYMPSP